MSSPIKVGVLTIGYGPYVSMGDDGLRGVKLALHQVGGVVAGRPIQLVTKFTDASPQRTLEMVEEVVLDDEVDFVIGPVSGNEGLALRNFARSRPDKVFLNGSAGAQEMTMHDPAPNFFSFSPTGQQVIAGLGNFAYQQLRHRKIVTIAEDYSFPYAQVGGFMVEFCRAGGSIIDKLWVPLGTSDYSAIIKAIPAEADAILVILGGTDAIEFIQQYEQSDQPKPMLGGLVTADQTVLSASDPNTGVLQGMISAGPTADDVDLPAWKQFVEQYHQLFKDGFHYPSFPGICYYLNCWAALLALEKTKGDARPAAFIPALSKLKFDSPVGQITLDRYRHVIMNNYITSIAQSREGILYRKQLQVVPNVSQTLGLSEADYLKLGWFTRDNPACGQFH